ncbi:MAG: hypothetical protein J6C96_04020 [Oscillospiraceae bacterium]|nr:hypothetical protein [Oscillospiraceae bacterium]
MTIEQFRSEMIGYACGAGKALMELSVKPDIKIEPEQVRKNVATILVILTEVTDFLQELSSTNNCSGSD